LKFSKNIGPVEDSMAYAKNNVVGVENSTLFTSLGFSCVAL
jgi:hypothetical protein